MANKNPWESEEFTDFINEINELATEKYGWNVDGYHFETNDLLELILQPAIGSDSLNRKF